MKKLKQIPDAFQAVRDHIIELLNEAAAKGDRLPWHKPWKRNSYFPKKVWNGREYFGRNVQTLTWTALSRGYKFNLWGSANQWKTLGGIVKIGKKASPVVFIKQRGLGDK